MISISKKCVIDKLNKMVNKCNNTYQRTIKMKLFGAKTSRYIYFTVESNNKNPKLKVGNRVRISKYKNIFAKCYSASWSKKVFGIK